GPISDLQLKGSAPTPIPPGTAAVFGFIDPTGLWQSVNATADFSWSARAMSDMYRQATGEHVNGVIAVDVPGLIAVLNVVGPVSVPGLPRPLTAGNAAQQLLHDLYQHPETDHAAAQRESQATVAATKAT